MWLLLSLLAVDGAPLWQQSCAVCHGATGLADTRGGKLMQLRAFSDEKWQSETKDDALREIVRKGKTKTIGNTKFSMPAYTTLKDEEVDALIAVIRSFRAPSRTPSPTPVK